MYRSVFTPTESNNKISLSIPREWYGKNVEVIVFQLDMSQTLLQKTIKNDEHKLKPIPAKYLFDTKKIKFNRDEANDNGNKTFTTSRN